MKRRWLNDIIEKDHDLADRLIGRAFGASGTLERALEPFRRAILKLTVENRLLRERLSGKLTARGKR